MPHKPLRFRSRNEQKAAMANISPKQRYVFKFRLKTKAELKEDLSRTKDKLNIEKFSPLSKEQVIILKELNKDADDLVEKFKKEEKEAKEAAETADKKRKDIAAAPLEFELDSLQNKRQSAERLGIEINQELNRTKDKQQKKVLQDKFLDVIKRVETISEMENKTRNEIKKIRGFA